MDAELTKRHYVYGTTVTAYGETIMEAQGIKVNVSGDIKEDVELNQNILCARRLQKGPLTIS